MINRKQLGNLERLTRVINEISGRTDNLFSLAKKEIVSLQQEKIVLANKLTALTTRVANLETKVTALETK